MRSWIQHKVKRLREPAKLRAKYTHFRKTTLLKRVCNTTEDPCIYDEEDHNLLEPTSQRGAHDIRRPFSFKSNPRFIFHDSPGFEAGGEEELQDVLSFLAEKAKAVEVHDQLHAIWFCFTPDVARPLLQLEQEFFNTQRAGNVPVVAIFTKFDDLILQVYDRKKDDEENIKIAQTTLKEKFEKPLKVYQHPPRAYVCFESLHNDESNHQEQIKELIKHTSSSIDNLALKMLFVTVQQNNLEVCIQCAVNINLFQRTSDMEDLIDNVASWFSHCYFVDHDYGKKEPLLYGLSPRGLRYGLSPRGLRYRPRGGDRLRYQFVEGVKIDIMAQYKTPSLHALAAILVCLENSFWCVQHGSNAVVGFMAAWHNYHATHHVALNKQLNSYLRSKESKDWFTRKHNISEEEHMEYTDIILHNLLPHPGPSTQGSRALITFSEQP